MEDSGIEGELLMDGRRALVTGGAQGIGRAICEQFLRAGASVMAVDCDESALQSMAQSVASERLSTLCVDVEQSDSHIVGERNF